MTYGLNLSANGVRPEPRPLTAGDDVSWIMDVTPGDDQGGTSACVFYALAEWAGMMNGYYVSENEKRRVYLEDYLDGALDAGANFVDAFLCAQRIPVPWFKPNQNIRACTDLSDMRHSPILCGLKVTDAFKCNAAGCLDHVADNAKVMGYHAMLAVAVGQITVLGPARWVYLKNWWSDEWGYRGMCVCRDDVFFDLCVEMWKIV